MAGETVDRLDSVLQEQQDWLSFPSDLSSMPVKEEEWLG